MSKYQLNMYSKNLLKKQCISKRLFKPKFRKSKKSVQVLEEFNLCLRKISNSSILLDTPISFTLKEKYQVAVTSILFYNRIFKNYGQLVFKFNKFDLKIGLECFELLKNLKLTKDLGKIKLLLFNIDNFLFKNRNDLIKDVNEFLIEHNLEHVFKTPELSFKFIDLKFFYFNKIEHHHVKTVLGSFLNVTTKTTNNILNVSFPTHTNTNDEIIEILYNNEKLSKFEINIPLWTHKSFRASVACDIIEANQSHKILDVIKIDPKYDQLIEVTYAYPKYANVIKTYINSINIEFLDSKFNQLDFDYGDSIIINLNFRKLL